MTSYIKTSDLASKYNLSPYKVRALCEAQILKGAFLKNKVWYIPSPVDEKAVFEYLKGKEKNYTLVDLANYLTFSLDTLKNWKRLGKIQADRPHDLFSQGYVKKLAKLLNNKDNDLQKKRRNKNAIHGQEVNQDYIGSSENLKLGPKLVSSNKVTSDRSLRLVLSHYALALFYEKKGILYNENALLDFFSDNKYPEFLILLKDLLLDKPPSSSELLNLKDVLSYKISYIKGEDTLGYLYLTLQDLSLRKKNGAYYTPLTLTHSLISCLLDRVKSFSDKRIIDPACGSGNFFLGLLEKGCSLDNLYGFDLDEISVKLTRLNLALYVDDFNALDLKERFLIDNTLSYKFLKSFDLVVGNPPWGSIFSKEQKDFLKKNFTTVTGDSIESSAVFLEKALSICKDGGYIALLLPESLLSVAKHNKLREFILDNSSISFVSFLDMAFENVFCPSVILGLKKQDCGGVLGCKVTEKKRSFEILKERRLTSDALTLNLDDKEYALLDKVENIKNLTSLKNASEFALGIVTGNNALYIKDEPFLNSQMVISGKDVFKYGLRESHRYLEFVPEKFQQVAPVRFFKAKERLLYRFISSIPVFTYDDKSTLSLNSANILIPNHPKLKIKYVLAILNSGVAAFYLSKRFKSVKLLRSHIEALPIPLVDFKTQDMVIKLVDELLLKGSDRLELYLKLDDFIYSLYGLNKKESKIVKDYINSINNFLEATS